MLENSVTGESMPLRSQPPDLYRLVVKNLPQLGVAVFDHDLRHILAEGMLLDALGLKQENLIGKTLAEITTGHIYERLSVYYRAALDGNSATFYVPLNDQTFSVDTAPLRDDNGDVYAGMVVVRETTEQTRVEEALQEAEQRYHLIFENSADGILLTEPDGTTLMANAAACRMWGYTEEQMRQLDRSELIDQGDPALAHALEERERTGEFRAELRVLRADGSSFMAEISSKIFVGSDGRQKTCTIIRDMTERKRVEQALRDSEERLRQLAENLRAVVWLSSPDFNQVYYVSPACEIVWGCTPQELIDNPQLRLTIIHPDDREQVLAAERDLLSLVDGIEYRVIHPDGSVRWVWSQSSLVRNEQGEIYRVAGISKDITQQKLTQKALEESQQFMEQTAATVPAVLFIYDLLAQRNIYANRGIYTILGYTPQEIQQKGERFFLDIVHPEDREKAMSRGEQYRNASDDEVLEAELRLKDSNGLWHWISNRYVIFKRLADGTPWQVLGVSQDITEQKKAAQQAVELGIERERIAILTDFIRDVSHEFRTPLTIINSSAYLLRRLDNVQERAEQQQKIASQVSHLEKTLAAMLTISRLDSLDSLNRQPVQVNLLLKTVCDSLEARFQDKRLRLSVDFDSTMPMLGADESELSLALLNILENAIQYTPDNGQISISSRLDRRYITIEVRDTGIGIPSDDVPRIFERLFRGDKARSGNLIGPGLGLSIARRIIELHRGNVQVESVEGQGSVFRIRLPVDAAVELQT